MLIPVKTLKLKHKVTGVLHVGAHLCEEKNDYLQHFEISDNEIVWIEAMPDKVEDARKLNPSSRILNACVSDEDNVSVSFMIANNGQSSSMLEFETHLNRHPQVYEVGRIEMKTKTLQTLVAEHNIDMRKINFLALDIQGSELKALKGAKSFLQSSIEYIYTEVNTEHLYANCCLLNEIDEFLSEFDFERVQTEMTTCGWGDAFYVKKTPNVFNNIDPDTNGEKWFFENYVKDTAKVIFDVGCRFDSLFAECGAEVHYFDPCDEFIEKLQTHATKNRKSIYNCFGLGKKTEEITFYDEAQSFLNREKSCPWMDNSKKTQRKIKNAHEYVCENQIESIDFVKIDTEGYELTIIEGFGDSLRIIKCIQFEYGGTFIDCNAKLHQICNTLKENGFSNFQYLSAEKLVKIDDFSDHFQYCNIVCFNSKYY